MEYSVGQLRSMAYAVRKGKTVKCLEYLGEGWFSEAYLIKDGSGRVLKVAGPASWAGYQSARGHRRGCSAGYESRHDPYWHYAKFAMEHYEKSTLLPKIYAAEQLSRGLSWYVMERLTSFGVKQAALLDEVQYALLRPEYAVAPKEHAEVITLLVALQEELDCKWDTHSGNWASRPNGELVLTDPWS